MERSTRGRVTGGLRRRPGAAIGSLGLANLPTGYLRSLLRSWLHDALVMFGRFMKNAGRSGVESVDADHSTNSPVDSHGCECLRTI